MHSVRVLVDLCNYERGRVAAGRLKTDSRETSWRVKYHIQFTGCHKMNREKQFVVIIPLSLSDTWKYVTCSMFMTRSIEQISNTNIVEMMLLNTQCTG